MVARRLTLTIDAEAETCGACSHNMSASPDASDPACQLFQVRDLDVADRAPHTNLPLAFKRAPECLAAEDAARPWHGSEDDDDPVPHHLQEKP